MWSRLAFLVIALFWAVMNFLLWRSEYGGRDHLGGAVPVEMVWRKMLTAPDHSSLAILHRGRKAGECTWVATAGAGKTFVDDVPVEGGAGFAGYRLNLEGELTLDETAKRVMFSANLSLDTNRAWQEFNVRINVQHDLVAVRSLATEQTVHLRVEGEDGKFEREIKLADLGNPVALAQALDLSLPSILPGVGDFSGEVRRETALSPQLKWEARVDWLTVARTPVRVYRLRAELFDRHEIVVVTSPLGELLRVELPGDWVLASDRLGGF
jgi:hypothetical protein